jgi:unsaturated rhamnogalacturonyl hydrolase
MMKTFKMLLFVVVFFHCFSLSAQLIEADDHSNDFNTPLHLMKSDYKVPYGFVDPLEVKLITDRILSFLDAATPFRVVDKYSQNPLRSFEEINRNSMLERGTFRLASYEWGVTYSGMLHLANVTGDQLYARYVSERFQFLAGVAPYFEKLLKEGIVEPQMRQMLHPEALDDAGAMCVAMIKSLNAGFSIPLDNRITTYINYIMNEEYRLADGTFARNRPQPNTVWLDDMYMAIPAIAHMGTYTGDKKYYDEAIRQVKLFAGRMYVEEKKLFRHGWVESMQDHPAFFWGRANGWAILTLVEVLDAIPDGYPERNVVLSLLRRHIQGLATLQSGEGFWHQLLDRNDSYLETSATAIFTYCIARSINEGWIDALVYGPVASLGWNAVSTMINDKGEVLNTCVGTGMGFDPAFYYYRPVHRYAAHGYGPVLLAGAEIIRMASNTNPKINDSAVQFYSKPQKSTEPIFWVE